MKQKKHRPLEPIRKSLYDEGSVARIRRAHDESGPYMHVVLDKLCGEEAMRAIHEECKNNMVTDFKETDLFKVYQTGELANLDLDAKLSKKMPELMALRSELYSDKFRDFVSKITGVDDLTDRCDCSANAYVQGCHLLCHDDVIGTRRVSYIIYLTDPDDEWKAEDGGSLELFPLEESSIVDRGAALGGKQGIPTNVPTCHILPKFNRMALFTVQPGRSYHSVQEVYADKPRISISGWFHGPDPPKGADKASLSQVMSKGQDNSPFVNLYSGEEMVTDDATGKVRPKTSAEREIGEGITPSTDWEGVQKEEGLTKEEMSLLRAWVNPVYLQPECMDSVRKYFCSNNSVQLKDFLKADKAAEILAASKAADKEDGVGGGVAPSSYVTGTSDDKNLPGTGWTLTGPPHKRRFVSFDSSVAEELSEEQGRIPTSTTTKRHSVVCGGLLDKCRHDLMESVAFAKLLRKLAYVCPIAYRNDVRRFRPGLDYTVAHFGDITKDPRLDSTLCFVESSLQSTGQGSSFEEKDEEDEDEDDDEEDDDEGIEDDEEDGGPSYDDEWASGDLGGFECYIEADHRDNGEAAESYRHDKVAVNDDEEEDQGDDGKEGDSALLSVNPGFNVLNLVLRDDEVMRFVKYVSAAAPSSRWDIAAEFAILQQPESDSDSQDDEESREAEDIDVF